MKVKLQRRYGMLVALLIVIAAVATACAPDPNELIISPQLGEQMVARNAGQEVARAEPTPLPMLSSLTPEQIVAGLPEDVIAALPNADLAHAEQLALSNGCIGCHALDPAAQMTGPTWYNIGNTAVGRVPGESPGLYLYDSIVNPGGYSVPNYPAGVMPATYVDTLTPTDLADLVAYLLAQTQGQ
jgi:mono/diheme cytochrome c family protein